MFSPEDYSVRPRYALPTNNYRALRLQPHVLRRRHVHVRTYGIALQRISGKKHCTVLMRICARIRTYVINNQASKPYVRVFMVHAPRMDDAYMYTT